jgi:hypothetical protein
MSQLPSILRSAALVAATFVLTPASVVTGTATVTAITFATTDLPPACARPRMHASLKTGLQGAPQSPKLCGELCVI